MVSLELEVQPQVVCYVLRTGVCWILIILVLNWETYNTLGIFPNRFCLSICFSSLVNLDTSDRQVHSYVGIVIYYISCRGLKLHYDFKVLKKLLTKLCHAMHSSSLDLKKKQKKNYYI